MTKAYRVAGVLGIGVAVAAACSSDDKSGNTSDLSASGQVRPDTSTSIALSDGARVEIPAGSVTQSATLQVATISQTSLTAAVPVDTDAGQPVAFTPHNFTFTQPVTVTIPAVAGADQVLRLDDEKDATWEVVSGATFAGGKATFQTTHFCVYMAVRSKHTNSGTGGMPGTGASTAVTGGASFGGASTTKPTAGGTSGEGSGTAPSSGGTLTTTGGATDGGSSGRTSGGTSAVVATGGTVTSSSGAAAGAHTGGASTTGGTKSATGGSTVVASGGNGATASSAGTTSSRPFCPNSDLAPVACYSAAVASSTNCASRIPACCSDSTCSVAINCTVATPSNETSCRTGLTDTGATLYNYARACLTSISSCPFAVTTAAL